MAKGNTLGRVQGQTADTPPPRGDKSDVQAKTPAELEWLEALQVLEPL